VLPRQYLLCTRAILQDFATLQSMMDEIQKNIVARQDKIALLSEEVRLVRLSLLPAVVVNLQILRVLLGASHPRQQRLAGTVHGS
jgi:hypothetical protein